MGKLQGKHGKTMATMVYRWELRKTLVSMVVAFTMETSWKIDGDDYGLHSSK